jgi:hypothetical protein
LRPFRDDDIGETSRQPSPKPRSVSQDVTGEPALRMTATLATPRKPFWEIRFRSIPIVATRVA